MEKLNLSSSAFIEGKEIPKKYGYKFENLSPPLTIKNIPNGTKSLALIMDDPDAIKAVGKLWIHWVVCNIPPTETIHENSLPNNAIEGMTDFGQADYGGPAPPDKKHTYFFKLYALDTTLDITKNFTKLDLEKSMKGHIIQQAILTGTFTP